jgi:hypothetical protein
MHSKRSRGRRRITRIQQLCSQLDEAIESSEELRRLLQELAEEAVRAADALERAPDVVHFREPATATPKRRR